MQSAKGCAAARQKVKNGRRLRRPKKGRGKLSWLRGKAVLREGGGGTDKSGSRKRSLVYYSQKPASR